MVTSSIGTRTEKICIDLFYKNRVSIFLYHSAQECAGLLNSPNKSSTPATKCKVKLKLLLRRQMESVWAFNLHPCINVGLRFRDSIIICLSITPFSPYITCMFWKSQAIVWFRESDSHEYPSQIVDWSGLIKDFFPSRFSSSHSLLRVYGTCVS